MVRKLRVYSDAASFNNGRKKKDVISLGSFATIVVDENNEIIFEDVKCYKEVTNAYCELAGATVGLNKLINDIAVDNERYQVEVITDAQYVVNGANDTITKWMRNGWKNWVGEPVANKDLWQFLQSVRHSKRNVIVKFKWLKGHKGKDISIEEDVDVYFNEYCDTKATGAIAEAKKLLGLE